MYLFLSPNVLYTLHLRS